MKKLSFGAIALLFMSVLFLSSCANNDDVVSNSEQVLSGTDLAISDPQVKKEIEFMRDKKIITESMYQKWLVSKRSDILDERDILIDEKGTVRHDQSYRISSAIATSGMMYDEELLDRKVVQELMQQSISTSQSRMKRAQYMFGSAGGTITCRIFTQTGNGRTAVTQEWKTALSQAITAWNNLGLKVNFTTVNATNTNIVGGYVNVYMQNRNNTSVFASASSPNTAGYFGENLIINTVITQQPDVNGKKTALIHELGHILGFKHTDEFANNTSIFNTVPICNEGYLGDSFMYGASAYNQVFIDFSTCDKINLQYYWGY